MSSPGNEVAPEEETHGCSVCVHHERDGVHYVTCRHTSRLQALREAIRPSLNINTRRRLNEEEVARLNALDRQVMNAVFTPLAPTASVDLPPAAASLSNRQSPVVEMYVIGDSDETVATVCDDSDGGDQHTDGDVSDTDTSGTIDSDRAERSTPVHVLASYADCGCTVDDADGVTGDATSVTVSSHTTTVRADDKSDDAVSAKSNESRTQLFFLFLFGRSRMVKLSRIYTAFWRRYEKWRPPLWVSITVLLLGFSCLALAVYLAFFAANTSLGRPTMMGCRDPSTWRCGNLGENCIAGWDEATAIRCGECGYAHALHDTDSAWLWPVGDGPVHGMRGSACLTAYTKGVFGADGGCASLRLLPGANVFIGTRDNTTSDSWEAVSYQIEPLAWSSGCVDLRYMVRIVASAMCMLLCLVKAPDFLFFSALVTSGFIDVLFTDESQWNALSAKVVAGALNITVLAMSCFLMYQWATRHSIYPANRPISRIMLFVIPYFLMLHYKVILKPLWGQNFSMTADGFADLDEKRTAIFAIACTGGAFLLLEHANLLLQQEVFWPVFGVYVVVAALPLVLASLIVEDTWALHIHHYNFGLLIWPLTRFRRVSSNIVQAIAIALFVHGTAAYGWDEPFDLAHSVAAPEKAPTVTRVGQSDLYVEWEMLPRNSTDYVSGTRLFINGFRVHSTAAGTTSVLLHRVPGMTTVINETRGNETVQRNPYLDPYPLEFSIRHWTARPLLAESKDGPSVLVDVLKLPTLTPELPNGVEEVTLPQYAPVADRGNTEA